jgi:hypothetical protein
VALLAVSGCATSRRPGRLPTGSDLARPEPTPTLAGTIRAVLQRCDRPTAVGALGDPRDPDRCGRGTMRDTVRVAPDTVERVQRVP